ncbi:hypothetical protein J7T55_007857 [Diaporthe amygdali]|uniref:uncharacterized protein n=1 Tax=Phomopsis amygdali TaxID=1214568 RepID=UPI0022FF2E71|nr:uncharacterized protein J7T55_007857 [Diaporthe amygdali]KAJ0114023.1 hypothetical protein J7T55_007857 [Diaporthe amygdali]
MLSAGAALAQTGHLKNSSSGLQIFLDFDGTIVTSDAYTSLAYAAYASLPANASTSVPSWDNIETTYGTVYDAVSVTVDEPTSLEEAIKYANNAALRAVEQWSFLWVQNLGVFDATKQDELVKLAKNQTLRAGWCNFATAAQESGVKLNVVSLNWSPSWIRLVLEEASECPQVVKDIETYCPEILPANTLATSQLNHDTQLFSGGDKTKLIERILESTSEEVRNVAFVSDGDADLQPLWEGPTNIGVVAGINGSAAESFRTYGIDVIDAGLGWQGHTGVGSGNGPFVYGFEDWQDVAKLLWG